MKKMMMIWFVAVFGVVALGCSLAPDTKQIIGEWWGTNQTATFMGITMTTNYTDEADSEMLMEFTETHAYMTSLTNGVVTGVGTNTYLLDEDAAIITLTDEDGSNMNISYILEKDVLTMNDSGVDEYLGNYSISIIFKKSK